MSSHPTTQSSPANSSSPPPPQPGGGRLIVLLLLLGVAIGVLAYDYFAAGPGNDADDKKLEKFVDELNRKGVSDSKRITPAEIQTILGRQPTFTESHPDQHYEIEYYCKWGLVPVLNMRRHYIAVVYVGDEPRRYNSHHKNERPPLEALPIPQKVAEESGEGVPEPETAAGDGKAIETPPDGTPAEGEKKRKGKKKQQEPVPEEKSGAEKTDAEKQDEKPEDKPIEKPDEKKPD